MRENHLMSPLNRASVAMCWLSPRRCQPMVFYRVCCEKIRSLCCLTIIPHHPTHVLLPKSKRRPAMGNTFVVWLKLWYPNTTDYHVKYHNQIIFPMNLWYLQPIFLDKPELQTPRECRCERRILSVPTERHRQSLGFWQRWKQWIVLTEKHAREIDFPIIVL